eukprot:scaffold1993_cov107-Cylindrotheca_fusiformis.AAC.1
MQSRLLQPLAEVRRLTGSMVVGWTMTDAESGEAAANNSVQPAVEPSSHHHEPAISRNRIDNIVDVAFPVLEKDENALL